MQREHVAKIESLKPIKQPLNAESVSNIAVERPDDPYRICAGRKPQEVLILLEVEGQMLQGPMLNNNRCFAPSKSSWHHERLRGQIR